MSEPFQNQVGWNDPIVAGEKLIRTAIKSDNYVPGVSGWRIARNGNAEFNNVAVRGSLHVGTATKYIDINTYPPLGNPEIRMNPDSATFVDGSILVSGSAGVTSGTMTLDSPALNTSNAAAINLTSNDYITHSRIELGADDVVGFRFIYQIGNGYAQVTVNSATAVPGANVTVVSVTMANLKIGRIYRITIGWHGIIFGTPVAVPGNRATMHIGIDGAFGTAGCRILGQNANGFAQSGGSITGYHTATATSHTYAMILQHEAASTAATLGCSAVADSPAFVSVSGWKA